MRTLLIIIERHTHTAISVCRSSLVPISIRHDVIRLSQQAARDLRRYIVVPGALNVRQR